MKSAILDYIDHIDALVLLTLAECIVIVTALVGL